MRKPPSVSATSISESRPAVPTSASVSASVSASTSSTLPVPPSPLSVVTPSTIVGAPFFPVVLRLIFYFPKVTTARAIPTPSNIPSSSFSAIASSSTSIAPDGTGGLSTGSLIGIIGGSIGALAVIGLVAAFFLRRLRTQKTREGFDPTKFRRSAIILNDKDENAGLRPRPPTMIERRKAQATNSDMAGNLLAPSMAFPYSDQTPTSASRSLYENGHPQSFAHYGASDTQPSGTTPPPIPPSGYSDIPGSYGVPPPLGPDGAQHEQAGYGAPPIPGTYGPSAYAAYGPDPRYPRYQYQNQRYPHFSPHHQTLQYAQPQQMFGSGNPNPQPSSVRVSLALPNPHMNSPKVSPNASPPQSPLPLTETQSSSLSSLTRQPTQSSGAPPAYLDEDNSRWDISRKDVKSRLKEMSVANGVGEQAVEPSSDSATATPAPISPPLPATTIKASSHGRAQPSSTALRPTSAHTLYDQDDVYGGI